MNISEEFNKMYNSFMSDKEISYETKSLLTNCYGNIQKSLKVFELAQTYPDIHRRVATYTYNADGILVSEKVNKDKNAKVMEYCRPVFDRGEDAMEVILHIFKNDNGVMIFADPPFVSVGTISQKSFWINDRLYDILDEDVFCKEIEDKIRDKVYKCKEEIRRIDIL